MSQPGSFGAIVPDPDWMVRKIQELEKRLNEQAAANPFAPMGISPKAGGIDVVGFLETLRADGTVSLRMATGGGAFEVCDSTGTAVARFGLMQYATPGQYGVEILYSGSWVQVGAGAVDWTNIGSKPTTFPPSAHTHPGADVTSAVADATGSSYAYNNPVGGTSYYAVWVDNTYKFGKNTSSIRYKENVRQHYTDPANVLALTPVIYDRKGSGVTEFGLIAEQVAEHFPELVQWFDGAIDNVRYDLLSVALLSVVKDQAADLHALTAWATSKGYTPPAKAPVAQQSTSCNNPPTAIPTPAPYTIQAQ
ncbi:tail fiber domain-containing protein [Arthrobacter sp. NA-172]|uniref:tail fiber domain-containing protein n=1 Tax=Arthrobacter sp. NA-172 TaxID=3367524 RepID=UPI003754E470